METNPSSPLPALDTSILTPLVRKSLGSETIRLLDWGVRQLGGGIGNPVSVGLYRVEGHAQERDKPLAWSIILKIIQSPANLGLVNIGEGDDLSHWNYWKREPLIYQSGFLETLPDGLSAPRCFGVIEQPGNIIWLWLEDIVDSDKGDWPLERYALAAHHLGQLNGMAIPAYAWLARRRLQDWLTLIPWKTFPWEHPQALKHYPNPERNPFRRLLADNERFLAALDRLPKTVCHGDTYPTNFMTRILPWGQRQIVALDWALAGVAPIGDDLGQLVLGAQTNLKGVPRVEVDTALFENYLAGLRDSGCQDDARRIRFGYTASAALRIGLFQLFMLSNQIDQNDVAAGQGGQPALTASFEEVMAAEAYALLEGM
jgi:hypothetical protein